MTKCLRSIYNVYMNTAIINIKTDPKVKAKAQRIASELGFSLSALINGYLNQLVRTKTIHFSVLEEEPSEYMIQALKESEEDKRRGRYSSFDSDKALEYLDNIINSAPAGPDDRDWTLLYNRLEENAVAKSLKSIGYKYYHFGSWWWPTGKNRLADENINLGYLSEFSARLVDSSILFPLAKKYNFPLLDSRYNQWRRINYQFDRLERIQSENSPVFVFAHFIIPHEPFVFESDGKFLTAQKESQKDINEKYLDQLVFLNGKIKSFVDIAVNSRGGNSVIILQSDEGPYPVQYESNKDSFDWTTVDYPLVSQKMAILNAIYFSDGNYEILKNGLSPVNTFRIIFNRFLGQNLPLLPDRYYLGNMSQPYNLIEYKKPPQ